MSRAVYVGGFGNGKANAEAVASALGDYYEEVDPFSFSQAIGNYERVRKAAKKADIYTHSAGILAVVGTCPDRLVSFNAPLPTTRRHLIGRTVTKTARMHMPGKGIKSKSDIPAVARYDASAVGELVAHPKANLGNLGKIAKFDAIEVAVSAARKQLSVKLVYTTEDAYYQLGIRQLNMAETNGVPVYTIGGEHDEVVLRPKHTLHEFFLRSEEHHK